MSRISAMSAPATKALSPAPVRITTRTSSMSSISLVAWVSSATTALDSALSALGRSMVSVVIAPCVSSRMFS